MNIVGYVFLGLIALGVLIALVFVVATIPDMLRYRRIRRM